MDAGEALETAIPLWLDCDTGHDDAFAILLAARSSTLNLLGISTVHGNASLEQTTTNTLSILAAIGRTDVPVHPGASKPFCRKAVHAPDIHGSTGLDGTTCLPAPKTLPVKGSNAKLAMRHALMAQPYQTAWIVATGALTNVALLLATFPELIRHIRGLSIMGGAIGGGFTNAPLGHIKGEGERFGNHTRWAEFNIYCDPEAAQAIFSNPEIAAKTTLIPLDLTHQVLADRQVQENLLNPPGRILGLPENPFNIRKLFHEILVFFAHSYSEVLGLTDGPPLHDPIAVAVLLNNLEGSRIFDDHGEERWHVHVVTDGLHSDQEEERRQLGRTMITKADQGGVRIPKAMNIKLFWDLVETCMRNAQVAIAPSHE